MKLHITFALSLALLLVSCAPKPAPVVSPTAIPSQPPTQAPTEVPIITQFPMSPPPPTVSPVATWSMPTLDPVIANGQEPPPCTFPLAQITATESVPENYTFSEPKDVIVALEGNEYNVAGWLPGDQQILVTENLHNQYVENNNTVSQQAISLYNLDTGKSKVYAMRANSYEPPIWQPDINGVVYSTLNYTNIDRKNGVYKFTRQLWISYGNPDAAQLLADNLTQFPLAINPVGSEIIFLSDKQISKLQKSLKVIPAISFDPTQWDYAKSRRDNQPVSYQMAWQPGTSLILLFSEGGFSFQGGYAFILDTSTGSICELNLGGPVDRVVRWSSDGRYMAIARATSYTGFSDSEDLVIFDSNTGNLRTVNVVPQDVIGKHFVTDITWTPDNLHLLVLENIPSTYDPHDFKTLHHELYFVDLISNKSIHLFPEFKSFFGNGIPGMNNFVWSPDGSKLLIRCPVMQGNGIDRFCLISIHKHMK